MEIYKQAIQKNMKIKTTKGDMIPQQLFTMGIEDLNDTAVALSDAYEKSGGKSFIAKRTTKDKDIKLQLDLVVDVLNTKMEEQEKSATRAAKKEHNRKVIEAIAKRQDKDLEGKSLKQLEAMLLEEDED